MLNFMVGIPASRRSYFLKVYSPKGLFSDGNLVKGGHLGAVCVEDVACWQWVAVQEKEAQPGIHLFFPL